MTWVLVHRLNPRAAPVVSGAGWRRHPRNAGSARRCLHGVLFGQQVAAIVEKAWAFYRRDIGSYDTTDNHNTAGISVFTALGVDYTKVETENFANGAAYVSAIKSALDAGKGVWLGAVGGLSDDTPMRMDDRRRTRTKALTAAGRTSTPSMPC